MLELYHTRDAVCPMKVRIALAEKRLEWKSHPNPDLRSASYLALNPGGYVPTLVHDGKVLTESRIISEYIEDAFPGNQLLPADPFRRHQARLWSKQIDDSLHLNIFILTFLARGVFGLSKLSDEDRQRRLPLEPVKRMIALDLLRDGVGSPWTESALTRFRRLVIAMDRSLGTCSYLAGEDFSLADADLSVYLFRLGQLQLNFLWDDLAALKAWILRVHARPSFQAGVVNWLTDTEVMAYETGAQIVAARARNWLKTVA